MKLKEAAVLFVEDEPFLRDSMGAWLARKAGRQQRRTSLFPRTYVDDRHGSDVDRT